MKIALWLHKLALATWYADLLQEGNPYVIETKQMFLAEEECCLCAGLSALDLMMRKGLFFICFQTGILLLIE